MSESLNNSVENEAGNLFLPAILPPVSVLFQRTQKTLKLLRDVVQESSAEYWYEQGKKASGAEEWEKAAYSFGRCLETNAQHWRSILQLAVISVQQHKLEQVVILLLNAYDGPFEDYLDFISELTHIQWSIIQNSLFNLNQKDFTTYLALTIATDDVDKMRELLNVACESYTKQAERSATWYRLSGFLWENDGQYEKALTHYDCAIQLNPFNASIYNARGVVKYLLRDFKGALVDYNVSILINSTFSNSYSKRATVKENLHDFIGASDDYSRAIELCPSDICSYVYRADIKRNKLDDIVSALKDYESAISLMSGNSIYALNRINMPITERNVNAKIDAIKSVIT